VNKQIQLLISQSYTDEQGEQFDIEKFAKLIVSECCAIADEVERADMDSFASKFIKAHFGIEE